jgi:hypothetical protein
MACTSKFQPTNFSIPGFGRAADRWAHRPPALSYRNNRPKRRAFNGADAGPQTNKLCNRTNPLQAGTYRNFMKNLGFPALLLTFVASGEVHPAGAIPKHFPWS